MDVDCIIDELRKMEKINVSYNYGVELLVMTLKRNYRRINTVEDLKHCGSYVGNQFEVVFKYDKVAHKGFTDAVEKMVSMV